MADEGASSSNSFDEVEDHRGGRQMNTYTSVGFNVQSQADASNSVSSSGHLSGSSPGIKGVSRISHNPFAIKTATPTRSLADSTETKESRPLVAPPTFILGSDATCSVTSSAQKIVLRPSALTAQAEKLKFANMQMSGCRQEDKENKSEDSNALASKEVNSTVCESNGKIHRPEISGSALLSTDGSTKLLSSPPPPSSRSSGSGESSFGFTPSKSDEMSGESAAGFVFGQNLHERVLNYEEASPQSSPSASTNLTFEEAASHLEESDKEQYEDELSRTKSLTESAEEYQSRQVKRKFNEVTVITGEEEESNVLQMNCKLFAFNKLNSSWQERGRGILRLNDREVNGILQSRVVMRTQGSLRVILNTKVWSGMTVEHPTPKTVRLSAIDTEGVKVFLIMANPKDMEQLFSALDWRVTTLKSQEETNIKQPSNDTAFIVEEATSSTGLPDTSSNDGFGHSSSKRPRISVSVEGGADSSTEMSFAREESDTSPDNLVDSTDTRGTVCYTAGGDSQSSG